MPSKKFPTIELLSESKLKNLSLKDHNKYHTKLASTWRNQTSVLIRTFDDLKLPEMRKIHKKYEDELDKSYKLLSSKKNYKPKDSVHFKKHWTVEWLDWDYKTHKTNTLKDPKEYGKKSIPTGQRGKVRQITDWYFER
jgi:hypothetical protein